MKNLPFFYNKEPIKFIKKFEKTSTGSFTKSNSNVLSDISNVKLSYKKKEFVAEFNYFDILSKERTISTGNQIKNVYFKNKKELIFDNMFVGGISVSSKKGETSSVKGYIGRIQSANFKENNKQYYKLVVPLKKKLDFFFVIEGSHYSNDFGFNSTSSIKTELSNETFFIINEKDKNKKEFLIIESNTKQTFEEFSNKTFSIRVVLGYTTGLFSGNRGYYFGYNDKEKKSFINFRFDKLRNETRGFLNPTNSNPYSWIRNIDRDKAEKLYKSNSLKPISSITFSTLCNKAIEDDDFLSVLLLIIESNTASLIFKSGGYSIALESLADIIIGDKKEKLSPITSKSENKKFREDLMCVLNKYRENEHFQDFETLEGRINQINQVTNRERLKMPFKILDIELLEEDIKVINSRNDFLHGRVPNYRNIEGIRSIDSKDKDLYYASVRLYTLLNMLILKYVGYENYVLNFSKIFENGTTYLVDEDFHRKV